MPHLRAMALMTLAMAAFALSDAMIKLMTQRLPLGQVIMLSSGGALGLFVVQLHRRGQRLLSRDLFGGAMLTRTLGEAVGTFGYTAALALSDLSVAAAILQSQPLVVTLAAAVFLRERVGWRRIAAISTGFLGVLIILRPASDAFEAAALWAVLGAIGLTARDLGSRALPASVSTPFAASWALVVLVVMGAAMMALAGGWQPMQVRDLGLLAVTVGGVTVAYITITEALRRAPVATVSPFRYTRMIFILALAYPLFGEVPDAWMWVGLALIIGSGLYSVARERALAQADAAAAP